MTIPQCLSLIVNKIEPKADCACMCIVLVIWSGGDVRVLGGGGGGAGG